MGWRENMKMELEIRGLTVIVTATYDSLTKSYQLNRKQRTLGNPQWDHDMPINIPADEIIEAFEELCVNQVASHVHYVFNEKLTPIAAHIDDADHHPIPGLTITAEVSRS